MAQIAETIVQEYYSRLGYFTLRGLKRGNHELDVLAIKRGDPITALHIEVQTSFRPVAYISDKNASKKSIETLEKLVSKWIYKKFLSDERRALREEVWAGLTWKYVFVHAEVKHAEELEIIAKHDVDLVKFKESYAR